jgi:hypothetical protein
MSNRWVHRHETCLLSCCVTVHSDNMSFVIELDDSSRHELYRFGAFFNHMYFWLPAHITGSWGLIRTRTRGFASLAEFLRLTFQCYSEMVQTLVDVVDCFIRLDFGLSVVRFGLRLGNLFLFRMTTMTNNLTNFVFFTLGRLRTFLFVGTVATFFTILFVINVRVGILKIEFSDFEQFLSSVDYFVYLRSNVFVFPLVRT